MKTNKSFFLVIYLFVVKILLKRELKEASLLSVLFIFIEGVVVKGSFPCLIAIN